MNDTTSLIKSYQGKNIRIREDKYVCLTDMASAVNKRVPDWYRLKGTESYLSTLSQAVQIRTGLLLEVESGTTTWAHPKVAIRFAQWCSDEFAVQVDFWIDELMTTGSVSIAPQPRQLPPVRDTINYIEAKQYIDSCQDPIFKSYAMQSLYEDMGVKALPPSSETLVLAAVKARSMGFTLKQGEDAKLGKWVAKHCNPAGKTQHGRYEVNVYRDDDRLVETIGAFFG